MTKEPDKSNWENNYNNKSVSGIEVRNKSGKVVSFITIKHDEILENGVPHRITIKLNENSQPVLPAPQTFEEIIQAKRRQQMLLYGSGSSSSAAILSDRRARQASAAARQIATAVASSSRSRSLSSLRRSTSSNNTRRRSGGSSRRKTKRRAPPRKQTSTIPQPSSSSMGEEAVFDVPPVSTSRSTKTPSPPKSVQTTSSSTKKSPTVSQKSTSPSVAVSNNFYTPDRLDQTTTPSHVEPRPGSLQNPLVTSLKDLHKDNPLFKKVDPKEVRWLLRMSEPGSLVELPDGTIIRKSKRGGARVGAGRKRSRPLPNSNDSQQASTSGDSQPPFSCNTSSSFSSLA